MSVSFLVWTLILQNHIMHGIYRIMVYIYQQFCTVTAVENTDQWQFFLDSSLPFVFVGVNCGLNGHQLYENSYSLTILRQLRLLKQTYVGFSLNLFSARLAH